MSRDEEDGESTCACKDMGGRLHETRLEQRQFEQSQPVIPRTRRVPARVLNHHLGRAQRNKCRDASLLCVLCRMKIALDGGKLQVSVTCSDACPLAHLLGCATQGRMQLPGLGWEPCGEGKFVGLISGTKQAWERGAAGAEASLCPLFPNWLLVARVARG